MKHTLFLLTAMLYFQGHLGQAQNLRARDYGIKIGVFPPGKWNAITDVAGFRWVILP